MSNFILEELRLSCEFEKEKLCQTLLLCQKKLSVPKKYKSSIFFLITWVWLHFPPNGIYLDNIESFRFGAAPQG